MSATKQNIVAMASVLIVGFLLLFAVQLIVRLVVLLHSIKGSPAKELAKSRVTLSDPDPLEDPDPLDPYFLGEWLNR